MNTDPQAQTLPTQRRLELLEGYLGEDPGNASLLADAWQAALAAGRPDRALAHAQAAEGLGLDAAVWKHRRAQACIALRDLAQAREILEGLRALAPSAAVEHDLAFVLFLSNDFQAAMDLLDPWVVTGEAEPVANEQALVPLQVLWLRCAHRLDQLDQAVDWVRARKASGQLAPAAAGVASLIALDADDYDETLALSDAALRAVPDQFEALVARGCVAMAQNDPRLGRTLLERALVCNANDGRTWSALGFASLQERAFKRAQAELERAVAFMPDHVGTWHGLGLARVMQGDAEGALQAFQQALALDRNFAESHGAVGLALALRGDQAGAAAHFERANRLDRANVFGRFGQALTGGALQSPEQVRELLGALLDRPGMFGKPLRDWLPPDRERR